MLNDFEPDKIALLEDWMQSKEGENCEFKKAKEAFTSSPFANIARLWPTKEAGESFWA